VLDKEFSMFISPWQSILAGVLAGLLMFSGSIPKGFGLNILARVGELPTASFNLLSFSNI